MSTDKGGSDLDVFDDLKPQTPDGTPITDTKRTLMGIQVPADVLPPVPGSRSIPPPPPSQRSRPSSGAPALPPSAPPLRRSNPDETPVTPPSIAALTEATPSEGMAAATALGAPPGGRPPAAGDAEEDTSPEVPHSAPGGGLPPSGLGLDSWATAQPRPSVPSPRISAPPDPRISTLPDRPAVSVASAAAPAAAGAAPTDIGWDDDDDKTQIYDKDTQAAAQSLLQPAAQGISARPPAPMSRPPGSVTASAFAGRTTAPPAPQEASFVMPQQQAPSQKLAYLFAIVGALVVALLFMVFLPKKGGLTVTAAGGPGNKSLAAVEVIVDNKLRCRESPCELTSLKSGTHYVEVRAAGYQPTAKSAVAVVGGQTAVHNVQLIRAGTGIKVFGEGTGLSLSVDGQEFGPLPQELRQMEPGEHVIQVSSGPRYEPFQQRITVDPDVMTPIGPIKLKVVKGVATIEAGENAEGADVILKVGSSRRILPALPVRLEVETRTAHVLVAKRKGFATFEQPIRFEDGEAKKTIKINLSKRRETPSAASRRRRPPADVAASSPAEDAPQEVASDKARLTLTSSPPSNVVLDGKPLGTTPLNGVAVEPGTHRIIFIHGPERKPRTIKAAAGSSQTVSVSF